jgi:hypothetical protein
LRQVAEEAGTSVARLVRALGSGLAHRVVTADELLGQVRKGIDLTSSSP